MVRNEETNENYWLFDLKDNRDEVKEHFYNALILESIPSYDLSHKVMHFIENKRAKLNRFGISHKLPKIEDFTIRIVSISYHILFAFCCNLSF